MSSNQNNASTLPEMSPKKVTRYAIVNSKTSLQGMVGKESLDIALILASYEMDVSLFFISDGVYQVQEQQNLESVDHKDYISTFKALGFYDIEDIYICQHSLQQRNLTEKSVFEDAQYISHQQLTELLKHFDVVLTF